MRARSSLIERRFAKCAPLGDVLSHDVFEDMWKSAMTSSRPTSSSRPAGIQKYSRPWSGLGTGDPQREQKSERNPVAFVHGHRALPPEPPELGRIDDCRAV